MKTNTQTFIELAIEGGWNKNGYWRGEFRGSKFEGGKIYLEWYSGETESIHLDEIKVQEVLLDPLAWQALGKVKGWIVESKRKYQECPKCGNGTLSEAFFWDYCKDDGIKREIKEKVYTTDLSFSKQVDFVHLHQDGKSIEEALGEILK